MVLQIILPDSTLSLPQQVKIMKDEISVAVRFLVNIIEINNNAGSGGSKISKDQLESLKVRLTEVLTAKYQNHWFPEKPTRGQAFRCIRLNKTNRRDHIIKQATDQCGLAYDQLRLPFELTIWVDPNEVCCRFGEQDGSFCTLGVSKNGNWEVMLDDVNFEEIQKKRLEVKEKVAHQMSTRKNGPRILPSSSPSYVKPPRAHTNGFLSVIQAPPPPTARPVNTPSPSAINWNHNHASATANEMFSSSPPTHFSMYNNNGLSKFSPPKYGFGPPTKWSTPMPHPSYGPAIPPGKGDKYHWFNSGKPTVKA